MDDNCLTITFPEADADAANAHYELLCALAETLGRSSATWKITDGWFNVRLKSREATDRLQAEAVPLPPGWTMRVGQSPA